MRNTLQELTGKPARVVPVPASDWLGAVTARGWEKILLRLHRAILHQTESQPEKRVILVGHSAGGVMGRLYLSPTPFRGHSFAGLENVEHLITLGSPHKNVRGARMRRWVDRTYPGAHFSPQTRYSTVAGRVLKGDRRGELKCRIAHSLYRDLSGDGTEWGDGLVPLSSARLDGADNHVLDGVRHAPIGGGIWYGTPEVVREWWGRLEP